MELWLRHAPTLLLWRVVLDTRPLRRAGLALGAASATLIHGGLLVAMVTLASHPACA